MAEQEKVDIRLHTIIYNLTDEIKRAMTGLLEPVFKEVYKGKAEVRETFRISKVGNVAGCQVMDGSISSKSEVRLLRDNVVVYTGKIGSLRRFKDDVSEVKTGHGMRHHARKLLGRQTGRRDRGVRDGARRHRSLRLIGMAAIGVLTLELRLENSHSLKDKRHVVESLKDRLRHKFNVAVAEIDHQDLWQRAAIAAVTVSSDRVHAEKVLRAVEEEAVGLLGAELAECTVEWLD